MALRHALLAAAIGTTLISCRSQSATDVLNARLDNLTGANERKETTAQMRDFLWSHWNGKKAATLNLTAVSKEGKVTHAEYKIMSLPGDTLLLKVTFVRDRIGAQGQIIPRPGGGYEVYTVDRVQSDNPFDKGPQAKLTVLPRGARVPATDYWLRFQGWNNELITYF